MKNTNRSLLILILGLLSAIGPFSIDMYLPGFPVIAQKLNTTVEYVAYSLSSFFIGVCVGQLLCGPLLDRFGRKRPLVIGLLLYIAASVACSFTTTADMLILFRFVQALGCCVAMVAPSAIVRDVFPVAENARIFSLLILILGVSPILAPTVGSFLVAAFGWASVFLVLAAVTALVLLLVVLRLPESKAADPSVSLRPAPIVRGFANVIREPQFATYAFAGAIAAAGLFAYLAGSPFVFMSLFGVSEQAYGWIFALIAAGLIGCSQLNNVILKKYTSAQVIRVVLITQASIGLVLAALTALQLLNLYSTIGLMFLFLSCQGFTFPNSAALAMAPFTSGAGSASALMGALQMAFGALASALVGILFNNTALPTAAIMSFCSLMGLMVLLFGNRRIRFQQRKADLEAQRLELIETL
ncbi:MFS transporter, DHA1 family, bicyclomycin/chloramphenicol resistance protein [Cnuella takakiae]|uniref:MFS transporter, DHA1 family, bicyclomycin/chloramphenicol resistance protein n=1 Tax=Cnuella takakiae TaxID=1302690 RepID=A0A1M4SCI9_9BACT|nr:multidrug effflux MFS transporter [Cnuella takakiae]OLY94458.1 Bcr/CflA family drug resistance efflux transporter [Cnuella takakiae]SHE29747.1 MFS transporter, DHA1 family, bicyclomycin/chloramphenicol resistance protein [Cnuella takakiae]